jgi:hypothetical protein
MNELKAMLKRLEKIQVEWEAEPDKTGKAKWEHKGMVAGLGYAIQEIHNAIDGTTPLELEPLETGVTEAH